MITRFLWKRDRTSLAVQWLQRSASSADGVGLICMVQSKKKEKRRHEGQRQSQRDEDRSRDQSGAGCEPRVRATLEAGNPPGNGFFLRACQPTSDSCLPEPKRISLCHLKPLCCGLFSEQPVASDTPRPQGHFRSGDPVGAGSGWGRVGALLLEPRFQTVRSSL